MRIVIGISPCPNDTFVFHGLLTGAVRVPGLELEFELQDVQALNVALSEGRFDAAKTSSAAALRQGGEYVALRSGAALGFGVGPVLLAAEGALARLDERGRIAENARVLCPGETTTASLLFRLFRIGEGQIEQVVFSEILPRLARGAADFGVCIHEGRFTWQRYGLSFVEDLGARWERHANAPLPLGVILARRRLGLDVLRALDAGIRASLEHARAHREDAFVTMREHAQELDDESLWKHVDLYVNAWTRDLGTEGADALRRLTGCAHASGWVRDGVPRLQVLDENLA